MSEDEMKPSDEAIEEPESESSSSEEAVEGLEPDAKDTEAVKGGRPVETVALNN